MTDPNHDIVPTLRMFDGLMMNQAADEIERLRAREEELTEMLRSAHAVAARQGEGTAWDRLAASIRALGIGSITARTYRVLPSEQDAHYERMALQFTQTEPLTDFYYGGFARAVIAADRSSRLPVEGEVPAGLKIMEAVRHPTAISEIERLSAPPAPAKTDARVRFEAWAMREGYPIAKVKFASGENVYDDPRTHAAWWAFQAVKGEPM